MAETAGWGRVLRAAFPHTIPILAGFGFLGMTYGILMKVSGFPIWFTVLMSVCVFAGSMQFVAVNLLLGPFQPLSAFAMTLMINARHLFYGISMLEKYRGMGLKKLYLIFGMCDETFSINCSAAVPEGIDRGRFYLAVTLLNQCYWVLGSTVGAVFGSFLTFSTEGLDFAMTAMFTVIFLEQWLKEKSHVSSLLGLGISCLCLVIFGSDGFIIPSMLAIIGMLTLLQKSIEKGDETT